MQAVSSKFDDLIQAEPTERQSDLRETEYDPDNEEPAAKSSKLSKTASKHDKSARSRTGNQQQPDNDAPKGDSKKSSDVDGQVEQEENVTDIAQESTASRGGLSPAGLAWPKRPPRGK